MDINFSVALDQPPQERDFFVAPGDTFNVIMTVYAQDVDDGSLPVDTSASTMTFEMYSYPSGIFTAVGNVFTFNGTFPQSPYRRSRRAFRIVMTDNVSGARTTLCYGHMVTPRMGGECWGWGWGAFGSDYGWI